MRSVSVCPHTPGYARVCRICLGTFPRSDLRPCRERLLSKLLSYGTSILGPTLRAALLAGWTKWVHKGNLAGIFWGRMRLCGFSTTTSEAILAQENLCGPYPGQRDPGNRNRHPSGLRPAAGPILRFAATEPGRHPTPNPDLRAGTISA